MGLEREPEPAGKGRHLRRRDHPSAGAMGHHHVGVVDLATLAGSAEKPESLGQEYLGPETVEGGVVAHEHHAAMAKHQAGALRQTDLAADRHLVRGRVVLHLFGNAKVISACRELRLGADLVPAAVAGESRVGKRRAPRQQLLVDQLQVALVDPVQLPDGVFPGLGLLLARRNWDLLTPGKDNGPDTVPGDFAGSGNGPDGKVLVPEQQDGGAHFLVKHGWVPFVGRAPISWTTRRG